MFRLSDDVVRRRIGVVAAVVAGLVATLAVVGCRPASASDIRVRHSLFGMHDGTGSSLSYAEVGEGAIRLWDTGTQWQQIEVRKGVYHWGRLDQLVTAAQAAHAEVTFVVAMTPHAYSSDPTNLPAKRIGAYKSFLTKLMQRYKRFHGSRGIDAYEVWNEANIGTFWTGSPATMAKLTKAMYDVRNKVDKRAKVIGPAMVTRLDYQLDGLSDYYRQRVGGKAVWRYLDAIALSLYPLPTYGRRSGVPEDSIKQLKTVKKRLHRAGVPKSKAIWNTEVNYGLTSGKNAGKPAATISRARQASNVVRTYLLNAAIGVKRVFWYRYDMSNLSAGGTLGNTLLTSPTDPTSTTAAAGAYRRAQRWMHGKLLGRPGHRPCDKDRHGTYECVVKSSSGKRYVYWNPFKSAKVRLPKRVHDLQGVLGATSSVKPRSTLKVGYKPVMVH